MYLNTGSGDIDISSKVNIWNVNCALATSFIVHVVGFQWREVCIITSWKMIREDWCFFQCYDHYNYELKRTSVYTFIHVCVLYFARDAKNSTSYCLATFLRIPDSCVHLYIMYSKHCIYLPFIMLFRIFWRYSISQEICARFLLCCALLMLYIDWFSHIHQAYFTGTVAI